MGIRISKTDSRPIRRLKLILWFPYTIVAIILMIILLPIFLLYEMVIGGWKNLEIKAGLRDLYFMIVETIQEDYNEWMRPTGSES